MAKKKTKLELLAPAKNAEIAITAINSGADAVYIGAARYGARSSAGNSLDDIKRVVDYAHQFNVKIYVTINTIIYDNELNEVRDLIHELYKIGVDALIVQDMAILRMDLPPIAIHASTQCDIRLPEKAEFLENVGFSQLVLARELSIDEIKSISSKVNVPLEAFIHGSLCVSYSGRCGLSYACTGRSANRGECAQMCRLPYNLEDENGNVVVRNKHLLSLKDFNLSNNIPSLIEAGVSSFKIEGRLKDVDYVKNVVAYYRAIIDQYIKENDDLYERSSQGSSTLSFTPQLDKVFNRSFTTYFFNKRKLNNGFKIASIDTPKSYGERIGEVVFSKGNTITIKSNKKLNNGDGISYFDEKGEYCGFRVNKVQNNDIITAQPIRIKKGTILYRTLDKCFIDVLEKDTNSRKIYVDFSLRTTGNVLCLDAFDERNNHITAMVNLESPLEKAKNEQAARQVDVLNKTGNTIYVARNISVLGEYFIPNSLLAELKRSALSMLDSAQKASCKYDYRRIEKNVPYFKSTLDSVDNVANNLSYSFYKDHNVDNIEYALEHKDYRFSGSEVLMHTRYCILRELGYCRKESTQKLPTRLYITNDKVKLIVETDCKNCEMKILKCGE